ncbi:MAG: gliding motility-associated C-terminal domain-containing protein [Saprospiraceae bacterium]|nr:gliding motility-associated C-terminal domain-containing protein [Saprospiraceae bacterium]
MRSFLLSTCIMLSTFSIALGQAIQIKLNDPKFASVCEFSSMSIEFDNTSNVPIGNIDFSLHLPVGVQYVPGTITSATEKNINNRSIPEFTISSIPSSSKITCQLTVVFDCSAFDASNEAVMLRNKIIASYNGIKDSVQSNIPYNLFSPFLLIQDVPDISKESSSSVFRQIKITNTRIGPIRSFEFTDDHDSADIFSANGNLILNTPTQLKLTFGAKDFLLIGDKDSLFERDETILVDQVINNLTCIPKVVKSTLTANWGCSSQVCQSSQKFTSVLFTSNTNFADIQPTAVTNRLECICDPFGAKQELILTNRGSADAENIEVEIFTGDLASGQVFGLVKDSISFQGNPNIKIDTIEFKDALTDSDCKGNFYYKLRIVFSHIPAKEFVRIQFRYGTCLLAPIDSTQNLEWKYGFRYFTKCIPNSENTSSNRVGTIKGITKKITNVLLPNFMGDSIPINKIFDLSHNVNIQHPTSSEILFLTYYIPCNFTIHDTSFLLNNKLPIHKSQIENKFGTKIIKLYYAPPFQTNVNQVLKLSATCNILCLDTIQKEESRNLISSCEDKEDLKVRFQSEICAEAQLSCIDTNCVCGPFTGSRLTLNLDCPPDQRLDTIPAYLNFTSDFRRANVGLEDNNNDRFTSNTNLDSSLIDLKKFVTGDTIINEFFSIVKKDNPFFHSDSIVFYIQSAIQFAPISSYVSIYDRSTNQYYSGYIPLRKYKSTSLNIDCGQTGPVRSGIGQGDIAPITPQILRENGINIPLDFIFEEGDSIYSKILLRFVSASPTRVFKATIRHYAFLFDSERQRQLNFSCGINEFIAYFITNSLSFSQTNPKATLCGDQLEFPIFTIGQNPLLNNFFQNEFRSLLRINSCNVMPNGNYPGIEINSLVFNYFYKDSLSCTLIRKDTVPLLFRANLYSIDSLYFKTVAFDEAFEIEISMLGKISDCEKYYNNPNKKFYTLNIKFESPTNSAYVISPELITLYESYRFNRLIEVESYIGSSYIEFLQKNIISASKQIDWQANVKNLSYSGSYLLELSSKKKLIRNFNIRSDTGFIVKKVNDSSFHVLNFKKNRDYILQFTADNFACESDSICMNAFWYCTDTISTKQLSCDKTTLAIELKDKDPLMELNVIQDARAVDLCDTIPEYMIELYNANEGTAYQVVLDLYIPQGVSIIPSTLFIDHATSNGFIPLVLPELISTNYYRWDFNKIIPDFINKGLLGVNSFPKNRIRVKFKAIAACDAVINSNLTFYSTAESNCNEKTNQVFRSTNKIQINNVNTSHSVQLLSKITSASILNDDIEFEIEAINTKNFDRNDSIEIVLPFGIKYVANSMIPIQGIVKSEPLIIMQNGVQTLRFSLEANPVASVVKFKLRTYCWNNVKCDLVSIRMNCFYREQALCILTNEKCPIYLQTGQTQLDVNKICPELRINDFTFSKPGRDNFLSVDFTASYPSSFENDSLCIAIFSDSDGNAKLSAADKKIIQFAEAYKRIISGMSTSRSFRINDQELNTCHFFAVTIPKTCICGVDTASLVLDSLASTQSFYTICAGTALTLGIDSIAQKKYRWNPDSRISCSTCPKFVFISNQTDSFLTQTFELEELDSLSCRRKHFFTVTINQQQLGKKEYIDICKGETVMLETNAATFLWRGEQLLDSTNKKITRKIERDQMIFLDYFDSNQCPISDTFCIRILDVIDDFTIASDTTIILGGKANLWVKGVNSVQWSPSNTVDCPSCLSTIAMPSSNTIYSAEILDKNNCPKQRQIKVTVIFPECDSSKIFIPNAFSPNEDQHNDEWFIKGQNLEKVNIVIYNRWGQKVFETQDIKTAWDGRYLGKELVPDVFGYCVEAYCFGGKKYTLKGNVSLLK